MALANYTDLRSAIGTWNFNRTDLPTADFVTMAEARMNRELKLRNLESSASLSTADGSRTVDLPSGFVSPIDLFIEQDWGRDELQFVNGPLETSATEGEPSFWSIEGETIAFERPCDAVYSLTLRYLGKLDLATTSTNWLLTNHPDIYLAACNVHAALYMEDDAQAQRWEAAYQAAAAPLNNVEARARRAALRTELAGEPAFNIYRG